MSLKSLFLAQFSHGSLLHLLGNLVFLFFFGAYVEQRMNRVAYFVVYVMGGSLGLAAQAFWFSPPDQFLIGASANVSAVMGLFFIFFFRFRMKFFVWYLTGRTFYASVSLILPFLYVFTDLVAGLKGLSVGGDNVAHFAHLLGFAFGGYAAFMIDSFKPVPWPFLAQSEVDEYRLLKTHKTLTEKLNTGTYILDHNPQNTTVRHYLLNQCIDYCRPNPIIDARSIKAFMRKNIIFIRYREIKAEKD